MERFGDLVGDGLEPTAEEWLRFLETMVILYPDTDLREKQTQEELEGAERVLVLAGRAARVLFGQNWEDGMALQKNIVIWWSQPWFSRIWVLQEFVLAREALFLSGDHKIEAKSCSMGLWVAERLRRQLECVVAGCPRQAAMIESGMSITSSSKVMEHCEFPSLAAQNPLVVFIGLRYSYWRGHPPTPQPRGQAMSKDVPGFQNLWGLFWLVSLR